MANETALILQHNLSLIYDRLLDTTDSHPAHAKIWDGSSVLAHRMGSILRL